MFVQCHLFTEGLLLPPLKFGCLLCFSYLIALSKTTSTMLNRNGKSSHLYLIPDPWGNFSAFHHWVWCSGYVFRVRLLQCWGRFFPVLRFDALYHEWAWILSIFSVASMELVRPLPHPPFFIRCCSVLCWLVTYAERPSHSKSKLVILYNTF